MKNCLLSPETIHQIVHYRLYDEAEKFGLKKPPALLIRENPSVNMLSEDLGSFSKSSLQQNMTGVFIRTCWLEI